MAGKNACRCQSKGIDAQVSQIAQLTLRRNLIPHHWFLGDKLETSPLLYSQPSAWSHAKADAVVEPASGDYGGDCNNGPKIIGRTRSKATGRFLHSAWRQLV